MSLLSIIKSGAQLGWKATSSCWNNYQYVRYFMLFDSALANILALHTLRHGTCFRNWSSIQFTGADPGMGAKAPGQTKHLNGSMKDKCENAFFLWRDGENNAHYYADMSAQAFWGNRCRLLSLIDGAFTPTLRFRLEGREIDGGRLERPNWRSDCYFTRHRISPMRLGVSGSMVAGVNRRVFSRIRRRPLRFCAGILQLAVVALRFAPGQQFRIFGDSRFYVRWPAKLARLAAYQVPLISCWWL